MFQTKVLVTFDDALASFIGFRPMEGISSSVASGAGGIEVDIQSDSGLSMAPDGVPLGYVDWQCGGEGEVSFDVSTTLSPALASWTMNVNQKKVVEKCVCVNIIRHQAAEQAHQDRQEGREELREAREQPPGAMLPEAVGEDPGDGDSTQGVEEDAQVARARRKRPSAYPEQGLGSQEAVQPDGAL